jgi:Zn finger protein HypA/HybF involved in hydrogenase expression
MQQSPQTKGEAMPVPFTAICPICRGKKYIYPVSAGYGNTDKTHGLPCAICTGKGILLEGELVRTDKLHILYRRVTHPEMQCSKCNDGRDKNNRRKKCPVCLGSRLKIDYISLSYVDRVISLRECLENS